MKVVRPGRPQKLPKPAPSVEDAPYMLVMKYAEPVYCASHKAALGRMAKELMDIRDTWRELRIADGEAACDAALQLVEQIGVDGGRIEAVVDPESGMKYRCELVRRQAA